MDHLTKKDWKELLAACGVRKGSRVLLQADLNNCPPTAGGPLTVLEALTETITPSGLLVVPAFTDTAVDPGCRGIIDCGWEECAEYRRSLHGYDPTLSAAELLPMLLLRMEGAARSDHPSRSFVLWGTWDEHLLKQPLDFPISFDGMLSVFEDTSTLNLLVGVPWDKSLLLLAMAHLIGHDLVSLEKAWLHRPRRNLGKTYLVSALRPEAAEAAGELLQTERSQTVAGPVQMLSLYSPPAKTLEIWKRSCKPAVPEN